MMSRNTDGSNLSRHMVVPIQAAAGNMGIGAVNPFGVRRGIRR
jgi:hypothetical protein